MDYASYSQGYVASAPVSRRMSQDYQTPSQGTSRRSSVDGQRRQSNAAMPLPDLHEHIRQLSLKEVAERSSKKKSRRSSRAILSDSESSDSPSEDSSSDSESDHARRKSSRSRRFPRRSSPLRSSSRRRASHAEEGSSRSKSGGSRRPSRSNSVARRECHDSAYKSRRKSKVYSSESDETIDDAYDSDDSVPRRPRRQPSKSLRRDSVHQR